MIVVISSWWRDHRGFHYIVCPEYSCHNRVLKKVEKVLAPLVQKTSKSPLGVNHRHQPISKDNWCRFVGCHVHQWVASITLTTYFRALQNGAKGIIDEAYREDIGVIDAFLARKNEWMSVPPLDCLQVMWFLDNLLWYDLWWEALTTTVNNQKKYRAWSPVLDTGCSDL